MDQAVQRDAGHHPLNGGGGVSTPIVAVYVDEILSAACRAGELGQVTATSIADAAENAFMHFQSLARTNKRELRERLRELSLALSLFAEAGDLSAETRDLIKLGVADVRAYLDAV
ncbi:hypothetical protein [Cupriavidus pinatubonensis]|uniref:hypothetical protein n=1 Tax=Cupriavidus pinatubonensis TaxID=248026 RepID=UPI00360C8CEC